MDCNRKKNDEAQCKWLNLYAFLSSLVLKPPSPQQIFWDPKSQKCVRFVAFCELARAATWTDFLSAIQIAQVKWFLLAEFFFRDVDLSGIADSVLDRRKAFHSRLAFLKDALWWGGIPLLDHFNKLVFFGGAHVVSTTPKLPSMEHFKRAKACCPQWFYSQFQKYVRQSVVPIVAVLIHALP